MKKWGRYWYASLALLELPGQHLPLNRKGVHLREQLTQASWVNAFAQALDSTLRLYSRAIYCENRPTSMLELAQGFDHVRLRLGIRAPPARLYLNQAPNWLYPPRTREAGSTRRAAWGGGTACSVPLSC